MKISHLLCSILILICGCSVYAVSNSAMNKAAVKAEREIITGPLTMHSAKEAYMDIHEHSNINDVIVAVYTPFADKAQIHKLVGNEMIHTPQLDIKQHTKFTLRDNGYHLMLIGIRQPLNPGVLIPVIFIFNDGSWLSVNARVK